MRIQTIGNRLRQMSSRSRAMSGASTPSTCNLAANLTSGVAKAVTGTGTTERYYKYVVTQTGTVTIAITNSTGA
jgi:hypothetical protein